MADLTQEDINMAVVEQIEEQRKRIAILELTVMQFMKVANEIHAGVKEATNEVRLLRIEAAMGYDDDEERVS